MGNYIGKKLRGKHTTYLDITWGKILIKKIEKESSVTGVGLGIIIKIKNKPKLNYTAKKIDIGIELTMFASAQKQIILIYTNNAKETAISLGLKLKTVKN